MIVAWLQIMDAVEALDPEHRCEAYWAGKDDRERAAAGLPLPEGAAGTHRAPRASVGGPSKRKGKRNR